MFISIINTIRNSTIKIDTQIFSISITRLLVIRTMTMTFSQISINTTTKIKIKIDSQTSTIFHRRSGCKLSLILILRSILRTISQARQIRSWLVINDSHFDLVQIKTATISRVLTITNASIKRSRFIKSTSRMRKKKRECQQKFEFILSWEG